MKARRLTQAAVDRIKPPSKSREQHFDSIVPGFCLRITDNGVRSWCIFYRMDGRLRNLTLGRYPALSLTEARQLARNARLTVEQGDDPQDLKKQAHRLKSNRRKNTFADVAEKFIENHAKKHNKTWKKTQYNLTKYVVPVWGDRPISSITLHDSIELIEDIADSNGPYTANYVRANLRKLYSWACRRGLAEINPVIDVERPISLKQSERDRVLTHEEVKAIWQACNGLGYPFGLYTQLLLITAQRRTEVSSIRNSDLDLSEKVWHLDRVSTKANRAHDVPLSRLALEIVEKTPQFESGDYIFSTTAGLSSIGGFSKAKAKLDDLSGVENWRFHDLRRTVGTNMTEHLGVSEFIVGRVLNHAHSSVTSIYARASYMNEKRRALDEWSKHLRGIIKELY